MKFTARKSGSVVATCAALLVAGQAWGAAIVQHSGNTDPTTEGWTLSAAGTGGAGSGTTHLGEPAWKMTDPIGDSNGARYFGTTITSASFDDPAGWEVKWRMAGDNLKDSTGDDEAVMQINDGTYGFTFTLKVNGAGAGDGATLRQRIGGIDLITNIPTIASRATGFHDFKFDYNPAGDLYRLFYDGNFVTDSNLTPGLKGTNTSSLARVRWGGMDGNNNDARDVDSYWNSVEFNSVPEPSSIVMCAMVIPALIRLRRHFR
jgi:hypothetical protein